MNDDHIFKDKKSTSNLKKISAVKGKNKGTTEIFLCKTLKNCNFSMLVCLFELEVTIFLSFCTNNERATNPIYILFTLQ